MDEGFEAATIRAIAGDAGVAVGTVLLYANSKQDLLQEVWRQEMMPVVESAMGQAEGKPLPEALMALFCPLLRAYATQPDLARVVVKELPWLQGPASHAHQLDLGRFLAAIAAHLQRAESSFSNPESTAELLFTVYYGACWRLLIPGSPQEIETVIGWLESQLAVVLKGSRR